MKPCLLYNILLYITASFFINFGPHDDLNKNKINDKPNKCIFLRY